jgi:hypothetical protein
MTRPLVLRDWLVAGLAAGIVSGITASVFAIFSAVRAGFPATEPFEFIAAAFGGPVFAAGGAAVPVGVLALFAYTILWAFGYLYASRQQPQLLTRPFLSGTGFGVIVWFVSQAILVGAGHYSPPTIYSFDRDMVGFIIFFGAPLTFVASRLLRAK